MLGRKLVKIWLLVFLLLCGCAIGTVIIVLLICATTLLGVCALLLASYFGFPYDPELAFLWGMPLAFVGVWIYLRREERHEKAESE